MFRAMRMLAIMTVDVIQWAGGFVLAMCVFIGLGASYEWYHLLPYEVSHGGIWGDIKMALYYVVHIVGTLFALLVLLCLGHEWYIETKKRAG